VLASILKIKSKFVDYLHANHQKAVNIVVLALKIPKKISKLHFSKLSILALSTDPTYPFDFSKNILLTFG